MSVLETERLSLRELGEGDAIGRRIELTVWRNGALVDIVVEPEELRVG